MKTPTGRWLPSTLLLALAGAMVAVIGAYFIFVRPPLLPEDIRHMHLSADELLAIGPRLEAWLTLVFRVLGGYALATGLLTVALATTAFRQRQPIAAVAAFLGGAASIGLMTAINFALDSDFKWLIMSFGVPWGVSLVLYWIERNHA